MHSKNSQSRVCVKQIENQPRSWADRITWRKKPKTDEQSWVNGQYFFFQSFVAKNLEKYFDMVALDYTS